jgi:hypothetical protein
MRQPARLVRVVVMMVVTAVGAHSMGLVRVASTARGT